MFGIGETELALILIFAFMIFGPDKLPGMGKTLGRALRQFRNAQEGFTQVVQTEIVDPAAEAMGDKKPNRKRSEEFEEDADIEAPEGEDAPAPRRAETFAERKKRLAAEKAKAAEAAAAASETEAAADDASADADAPAAEAPVAPAPAEPAAEPEENKPLTAADLYAVKRPAKTEAPADDQNQKEA